MRRFGGPVFIPVLFVALAVGGILKPGAIHAQKGQSAKVPARPATKSVATAPAKTPPVRKSTSGLGPVLAATRFDLVGVDVTVDPPTQTVPINTPTEIRTLVAAPSGVDAEAYLATINQNYRIRGELSGPAYANPFPMEVRIGESFLLPGFGLKGDYVLQNLRVVDTGVQGAPTVAAVTPDACVVSVIDQVLVTNVQVRELTYDEIVRSGIQITDSSYRFFNFTLALGTESNGVAVQIPVAFPPNNPDIPQIPLIGTPTIPNDQIALPDVQPVMLDIQSSGGDGDPDYWLPDNAGLGGGSNGGNIRVPGLVVFPGRVGFLNQFFEAVVIVANGSPTGSNLVVRNLTAKVKLPADGSLRVPPVQGLGVVTEKSVMGVGPDDRAGTPDDENFLAAGKSGQAKFLVEGLTEGLHTVDFDLQGTLTGLVNGRTAQISGTARGAVLVRDRTFATTFTHPGVVRAGQEYDLAMTVLNTGQANINGAFASLPPNSISGASLLPGDPGRRDFPTTILPGQSGTIKWRLRAGVTGQVTASYVKVGNGLSAGLTLVTGVGDRNIPLSPDSLILPDNACYLPPDVLDAARGTLGQAWSVATTPAYALPDEVTPISKAVVIRRAVEVGIAGLRVQFGESIDVSLATLSRDWVGVDDETVSPGFAEVLQKTVSGNDWHDGLGGYYRRRLLGLTTLPATPTCGNANGWGTPVGLADLHRNLIQAEAPRDGFLSAFVTQPDGARLLRSGWTDPAGKTTGFGPGTTRTGDIAQAGVSDLREVDFSRATETLPTSGAMLWATNPASGVWSLDLYGVAAGTAEVSVAVPIPGGRKYNRYTASVGVSAGSRHRVRIRPFSNDVPQLEVFQNGSFVAVGPLALVEMVSEPSPSVTEVRQVTNQVLEGGDDYGRLVGVLFNKPMSESSLKLLTPAAAQSRFRIGGGELVSNPNERVVGTVNATGAIPNYGKRFVFIRLDAPVGPFVNRTLSITGATDAGLQNLSLAAPLPIRMTVSPQGQPAGGFATGRVLNGDGSAVVGAKVSCSKQSEGCQNLINAESLGVATTDAEGRFSFDYVRNNNCANGPAFATVHPTTQAEKGNAGFVAFHGQNLTPDLVFLARGRVQGTVVNQNGSPSPRAFVQVTPTLDPTAAKVVQADETGAFLVNDLPVGSLAVKAQATVGNAPRPFGFAAGFIDGPNSTATVRLVLRENSGTARGEVREATGALSKGRLVVASRPGVSGPVGEIVGYAFTDNLGKFFIPGLPLENLNVSTPDPATNNLQAPVDWRPFTVTPLNPVASGLVLTLPGYGDVSGLLRDDAGNGLSGIVRCGGRGVRTSPDGTFLIPAVPQGTYDIEATENGTGFRASSRVQVTANQTTANVVLTVRRPLAPGTIEGYVKKKLANGTEVPEPGVIVTYDGLNPYTLDMELPPLQRQPIPVRTDDAGHYRLEGVPSGAGFTVRYIGNKPGYFANVDVEVAPNQTVTRNVVFNPATLKLRIRQQDGTPAVGTVKYSLPGLLGAEYRKASFGVINPDPLASGGSYFESLSNPDGTLEITMIPGLYRLGAYNQFGTASGITGTLAPGETLEHDFYLIPTASYSGSLRGTVYRPDGVTPVGAGVRVFIGLQDARTDADGKYLFPTIVDQSATLTATDPQTGETNQIRVATNPAGEVVQDIRLLGYGDVRVRVVDGAGQPVQNAIVTVTGGQYPNARRRVQLFPIDAGQTLLSNLFEGDYSIEAVAELVSGRAAVTCQRGRTVEVTIQVAETGTVVGKVWLPGRTAGLGLADVSLYSSGRLIGFMTSSSNADTYGDFRFVGVPQGPFEVRVFDNRTGRVGTSYGTIVEQNVEVRADVDLNSVGKVVGQVRSNGVPYSGITVEIQSPNATNFKPVRATTDAEGRFGFPGVPSGRFQIQTLDGPAGFNGVTTGDVPSGAEPLPDTVADINLRPSAKLQGTVFAADGATPVVGARVTVIVDGYRFAIASDEQGRYLTEWTPLGQGVVYAESPLGYDRGYSEAFTLSTPGATETRNVTLRGVGTIQGVAFNNDGQRLNQGTVSYTSTSDGNQIRIDATVQADGTFTFQGVPAGGYSLTLSVAGRSGVGAFSGSLASNETASVNLTLSDAGSVVGRTLGNGTIGIPNTKVTLRVTTGALAGTTFVAYTNASGRFGFAAVPLGNFVLRAENFALQAAADSSGSLITNEQTVDVGDLTLDGTPISVASVNPANGALASRDADVVLTFSEPANPATVNGNTIRVLNGTTPVSGTVILSADNLTATFHLSARFANAASFTVRVTTDLTDAVGNRMARNFESTFTTVDDVPPVLLAVDPADRAVQVPLTYRFRAVFNEPLAASQSANVIEIKRMTGQSVTGTLSVVNTPDGHGEIQFNVDSPDSGLVESANYVLTVQGVKDVAGNTQATPSVTRFSSSDFTRAVIGPIAVNGNEIVDNPTVTIPPTPIFTAELTDDASGINPDSLAATLDGAPVTGFTVTAQGPEPNPAYRFGWNPVTLADGQHTLVLTVKDRANNSSLIRSATFTTVADPLPVVTLVNPAENAELIQGQRLTLRATATDNTSVADVKFSVNGAEIGRVTSAPYEVAYRIPVDATSLTFEATATDSVGQTTTVTRTLAVTPDPGTTVTGRVVDANGNPVQGATATAQGRTATTDGDGRFSISNVSTVDGDFYVLTRAGQGRTRIFGDSSVVTPVLRGTSDAGTIIATVPVLDPAAGQTLTETETSVSLPFPVRIGGNDYQSILVSRYGTVSFDNGQPVQLFPDGRPTLEVFKATGERPVTVDANASRVVISWRDGSTENNIQFQAVLFASGRVQFGYGAFSGTGSIALTPGQNPTERTIDWRLNTEGTIAPNEAVSENFGVFDLGSSFITLHPGFAGGYGVFAQFSTDDRSGPVVVGVTPARDARDVAVSSPIVVTFNEPVRALETDPNFTAYVNLYQVDPSGQSGATQIPVTVQLNVDRTELTVTPSQLVTGWFYSLTLNQVRDDAGNMGGELSSHTFRTVNLAPTIAISTPAEGTSVVEGQTLTVTGTVTDDAPLRGNPNGAVYLTANGTVVPVSFTGGVSGNWSANVTVPYGVTQLSLRADVTDGDLSAFATREVTVTPDPLTTVTGRVVDANGQPVEGAQVRIPERNLNAQSGADGTFTFTQVTTSPGNLTVTATKQAGGETLFGASASTAPVAGGVTSVGDIVLADRPGFENELGTRLNLVNGSAQVNLPFTFSFYNQSQTSVFVNQNGSLTFQFAEGNISSGYYFGGQPSISPFRTSQFGEWNTDDFGIFVNTTQAGRVVFTWWDSRNPNFLKRYQATLYADGRIRYAYRRMPTAVDSVMVGLTPGTNSTGTDSVHFLSSPNFSVAANHAVREEFTYNQTFNLGSTVITFTPNGAGYEGAVTANPLDETGPFVTSVNPADSQREVVPNATISATFNEALDPAQNFPDVFTVSSFTTGTLPGTYALDQSGRTLTFTPDSALLADTQFQVSVRNQRDLAGNVQTVNRYWSFTTVDQTGPYFVVLYNYQQADGLETPYAGGNFSASLTDTLSDIDPATLLVTLDDVDVTGQATLYVSGRNGAFSLTPTDALSDGQHVFTLRIADIHGNFTTRTATLAISNQPRIDSVSPSSGSEQGGVQIVISGYGLFDTNGTYASPPSVFIGGIPATNVQLAGLGGVYATVPASSVLGPVAVTVVTNHGTAELANGFEYTESPQMPFQPENDTVLLWHLDGDIANCNDGCSAYNPGGLDAGPLGVNVDYSRSEFGQNYSKVSGRFGDGWKDSRLTAVEDFGTLSFGNGDFTGELWVKTDLNQTRAVDFPLLRKGDGSTSEFELFLTPTGDLIGRVHDSNGIMAEVTTTPPSDGGGGGSSSSANKGRKVGKATALSTPDDRWHSVAFVLDRSGNRLALYLDGQNVANAQLPAGFGAIQTTTARFEAGRAGNSDNVAIDEVRLSSRAHSDTEIANAWDGTALGVRAVNITPNTFTRGTTTQARVLGYNLSGATARLIDEQGSEWADASVTVDQTSKTSARLTVVIANTANVGRAQIELNVNGQVTTIPCDITAANPSAVSPETALLWRLDSFTGNPVQTPDESPNQFTATTTGLPSATGRFGGGFDMNYFAPRTLAGDATSSAFTFGANGFTAQGWVKAETATIYTNAGPVMALNPRATTFAVIGREDAAGQNSDFTLTVTPRGQVKAQVIDEAGLVWETATVPTASRLNDGEWHLVTLVADRAGDRLSIFIDGVERAAASSPSGFGTFRKTGNVFRAATKDADGPTSESGDSPRQQGGLILDEIRVLDTPLSAQGVRDQWFGVSGAVTSSRTISPFLKLKKENWARYSPLQRQRRENGQWTIDNGQLGKRTSR